MTIRQGADVIYRYIVEGLTMEKVGYATGFTTSEVSIAVEKGNFNRDRATRNKFQGGQDKGRYAPGRAAARGVKITRNMILDYLQNIDDWDYDFDQYVAAVAEDMAAERHQQEQYEQERREQEERRRQQAAREEQYRREQAARAEQQRRAYEAEQARLAAEKAKLEKQYPQYMELARKQLKAGKLQEALDAVRTARKCKNTYETNSLIAEIQSSAGNAASHADEIIRELLELEEARKKNGNKLYSNECLWLARAYFNKGNKSNACYYYFMAAEPLYEAKDYARADAIYTENDKRISKYSTWVKDGAFKCAYSRGEKKNPTQADHQYCVSWYDAAIKAGQQTAYAYANRSYHQLMLGDSFEAVSDAETAIGLGLHEKYVYNNLLKAQMEEMEFDDMLRTMDEMDRLGYGYEPWYRGYAIENSCDYEDEEALPYYRQQVQKDPNHPESLRFLSVYEKDRAQGAQYAIRYVKYTSKNDSDKKWMSEVALMNADLSGDSELIRQALELNPEEKAKRKAEEEQKRLKQAAQARLERERLQREEEQRQRLEALRRAEEAEKRRREEEKRAEEARLAEEERRRAEAEA
ncbi:MAG: hypothetical protein IIX84_01390, partial [Oscillospiraceae bacterium]|nr:hypothetical protein [Oscillospiraceae bacterium]